jgi:hypothetical protein
MIENVTGAGGVIGVPGSRGFEVVAWTGVRPCASRRRSSSA